jgi:hypothetical protein
MLILDRPITLRDTMFLKYEVASLFKKILTKADLPYMFDQVNKK